MRCLYALFLAVVAASDDSEPALAFARLIAADTHVVPSAAGHSAIFGDSVAKATVREWLKRND